MSWAHKGALHQEAHQSNTHVKKFGSFIALLMMPDSTLNFTAYHKGVVCTAISPRVPHLRDERWHHVVMSVDDVREVVRRGSECSIIVYPHTFTAPASTSSGV